MKIVIINGPNLNLLGVREPEIYGSTTFESYLDQLRKDFPQFEINYFQSNNEGEIIDCIQREGFSADRIIINAGAYTHSSPAIADALSAVPAKTIEVHISNVFRREAFRHHSYLSPVVEGVICGFGLESYRMALSYIKDILI